MRVSRLSLHTERRTYTEFIRCVRSRLYTITSIDAIKRSFVRSFRSECVCGCTVRRNICTHKRRLTLIIPSLFPHFEYGETTHLVLFLNSGFNVFGIGSLSIYVNIKLICFIVQNVGQNNVHKSFSNKIIGDK